MTDENQRQVYQELVAKYNEFMKTEFKELEGSNFAFALNKEYEDRTGEMGHSCFATRFYNDWGKRKTRKEAAKMKAKSQHEKLLARLNAGDLVSEKGFAFSLLEYTRHRALDMDYKVWWIGDCIATRITEEYGIVFNKDWRQDLQESKAEEALKRAESYWAELREALPDRYHLRVPQVPVTSKDFKRLTGQYRIPNHMWHEYVHSFVGTTTERRSKRKVDGDTYTIHFEIDTLCKVIGKETGILSARTKQPEYSYDFIFDRAASIDFLISVLLGFFDLHPKSLYRLKGGSQLILRQISWTDKPLNLELNHLCRIANLKTVNKTWRQKFIEGYLDELKQAKYISHWKKWDKQNYPDRKKETWYTIFKAKQLPTR